MPTIVCVRRSMFAEILRRTAGMPLEKGPEMGLVYEPELVRYLLNGFSWGKEQCFCPQDNANFKAQKDEPGGYKTMRSYLFHLEKVAWEQTNG